MTGSKKVELVSNKLYKLEALRGFAAIYVVFHHLFASGFVIFNFNFSFLFRFGQEAVILFFVLSGFVIYYSFERSKDQSFKLFLKKRVLRIFIPLIIVFITNYLLLCYYAGYFIGIDVRQLVGNILMLQDLPDKRPNVLVSTFLGNIPLWSLSFEWYFYLIFFVVFKKLNQSSKAVYVIAIISSISYCFYPNFINRELMYFGIWWVGVDVAKLYVSKKNFNFKNCRLVITQLVLISVILFINILCQNGLNVNLKPGWISVYPFIELRHFLFTILLVILAIVWKRIDWIGFDFIFKPFVSVAPISFGIYISHWFLVCDAKYLEFVDNDSLRLLLYMIICVLFSYLVEIKAYRFISSKINVFLSFK